jgi:phytoene dehydrogenase-like protein
VAQPFRAPAAQRLYDVCVIGSQLGGAVAGALLARRGFRVLHVDHDGSGGPYVDGGYLLPWAPAIFPPLRLLPAAEAALGELGFTTDLGRILEASSPPLQILLPRNRLDLPVDAVQRAAELRREFPADAEVLEAALAALGRHFDAASPFLKAMPPLPPEGFGDRRAVGKALKTVAGPPGSGAELDDDPLAGLGDHPLARALRLAARTLGHLDGPPAPLASARLVGGMLRGTYRLATGYEGLRDVLRRKIADARGEVLGAEGPPARVVGLDTDGARVTQVRVEGTPHALLARVFVVAADAASLAALLPEGTRDKLEQAAAVRTTRELVAVNLVVRAAALPPGLGDTALALGEGEDGDALVLQILPARRDVKKGAAGEIVADERVVCAAAFAAAGAGPEERAALARRMRDAFAELVPFFDRHLVRDSVPALAGPPERRGAFVAHPLYEVAARQTLGVTGIEPHALKNVVFAGRQVVPGLGVEGEFHAGVQAAGAAQALLGRRDLLR